MTAEATSIRQALAGDWPPIENLLLRAGLPTEDLHVNRMCDFLLAENDAAQIVGAIALEQFDSIGLLRSLVVAEAARGSGLGGELLAALENRALRRKLTSVWLLTIDADAWFERHGYGRRDREQAPTAIINCREFAELCPGTAVLMMRPTGNMGDHPEK